MTELFKINETKSPRLKWIEKHGITTHYSKLLSYDDLPWIAWDMLNDDDGMPDDLEKCGHGVTEDDALVMLCVVRKIGHWSNCLMNEGVGV